MPAGIDRREFLKVLGVGGVVFLSGMGRWAGAAGPESGYADFFFVQLSDTHWGFNDAGVNPDYAGTLKKAVQAVNNLASAPDFVVFTGDLTHTVDDPKDRRRRLAEFRDIAKGLKVKNVKFLPGEHDASLDSGEAFHELFGDSSYTFDHKGVHFIAIDNVSDPRGMVGDGQLGWLARDLAKLDKETRIVVLTHRPLFDLYPQWDWATRDGAAVIELLTPFKNVTVFYGHIHQEHHQMTGRIDHHAAKGLMYPLPPAGSVPKKEPVRWDPGQPYKGLGFRMVAAKPDKPEYVRSEFPVEGK
jgi:3',5'-cyclic AMP phosphodiesterase CpdA